MELKQSDIEALRRIVEFENTVPRDQWSLGWSWKDVGVYAAVLNKLLVLALIKCTYSSNRYTNYELTDKGKALAAGGIETQVAEVVPEINVEDLFSDIVGYDKIKELLREAMLLDEPIHVLLYGPPSIAKSMFLMDIEEAAGSYALPLLGSATSHAGMWDLMVERRPRFLLIDEIEKMSLQDMSGLLSLMEHKRIIRAKVGRRVEENIDCRVFAAANRVSKLPPELLSRFWKWQLSEYNASEFVKVVESVLVRKEGTDTESAHNIAMKMVGKTHDVRDAVRVARLSKRVGVEKALQLWGA